MNPQAEFTAKKIAFFAIVRDLILEAECWQKHALPIESKNTALLNALQEELRDRNKLELTWGVPKSIYVGIFSDDDGQIWYFMKFRRFLKAIVQ
jgi:hypothetical protein